MSIYRLKPRFQALLRPLVVKLYRAGVSANQVTVMACLISIVVGGWLCLPGTPRFWFLAIPVWMLLRMAMNAVDGMLAREFGQKSNLGAYLNELCDVVSDTALYLPFAFITPFAPAWVGVVIFLAIVSELAGALGGALGASRRYDGPMGKSDRAFAFGVLGFVVSIVPSLPRWFEWLMPLLAIAIGLTIVNRVRQGLRELAAKSN